MIVDHEALMAEIRHLRGCTSRRMWSRGPFTVGKNLSKPTLKRKSNKKEWDR